MSKTSLSYLLNDDHVPVSLPIPRSPSPLKGGTRKPRPRKFFCDKCGFGFCTNSDLSKHRISVHLQLRPYACTACGKCFGEKSNATKHYRSVHERQRNAQCKTCGAVFAFRDGLARHVKLVHDGVRKFPCPVAGCSSDAFKQSAHLKKHLSAVHNITSTKRNSRKSAFKVRD